MQRVIDAVRDIEARKAQRLRWWVLALAVLAIGAGVIGGLSLLWWLHEWAHWAAG